MPKIAIVCTIFISSLILPAISESAYLIHLKNGGRISTLQYWEENRELKFYAIGGIAGINKDMVKKIEKRSSDAPEVHEKIANKNPAEAELKTEKEVAPQIPSVKFDLKTYQDRMTKLKEALNKTLTRIRKANISNDMAAKDKATEENRAISDEMWKLTETLKGKNSGRLPDDWWEGVGKEEPEL